MIHSFLMIGQSNMAGRGFINEVEPIKNEHLKVLRNGRWQTMYTPVNPDREWAGISLAESFALAYHNDKGVDVGLIPCADGGTSIDQWRPGGLLFDNAIYQARLAMRTSTIAGVLWHQGSADCPSHLWPHYEQKLNMMLDELQRQLGLYDVPILLGGLGDFLSKYRVGTWELENAPRINDQLQRIAKNREMTGFVSAKGLTDNPDHLHFNARSLREFGYRYYDKYLELEDKNKKFCEKFCEDDAIRTELELL